MAYPSPPGLSDDPEAWLPAFADPFWFGNSTRDHRFEEFLNLKPDVRARVGAYFREVVNPVRRQIVRSTDTERFDFAAGALVANAIVATAGNPFARVHYTRDQSAYRGDTPYAPQELRSRCLLKLIDDLGQARAVFLHTAPAAKPQVRSPTDATLEKPRRSTYRFRTEFLRRLREEFSLTSADLIHDWSRAPVVFLRDEFGRNLRYSPDIMAAETEFLREYNDFIDGQAVSMQGKVPKDADLSALRLRRVFNHDLTKGGRFYGGFYQSLPEGVRERITINGNRTVELDYAGFLPRALYHEEGIDYRADPNAAPELVDAALNAGVPWKSFRKHVKIIVFMLLNSNSVQIHGSKTFYPFKGIMKPKQIVTAILKHNSQIAHRFCTGYSLTMMKKDSDLCASILKSGMNEGIPILPVHDSFIAEEVRAERLRELMISLYKDKFGFEPVIE